VILEAKLLIHIVRITNMLTRDIVI